jgi:hypothetical protein
MFRGREIAVTRGAAIYRVSRPANNRKALTREGALINVQPRAAAEGVKEVAISGHHVPKPQHHHVSWHQFPGFQPYVLAIAQT